MSISYDIGFTKKPDGLAQILNGQGFIINDVVRTSFDDGKFLIFNYRSVEGMHISIDYVDGLYSDDSYEKLKEIDSNIVATATVSISETNEDDREKYEEISRFLRDNYNAILCDTRTGKEVSD